MDLNLRLPATTILKILTSALLVYATLKLWPLMLLLFLGLMLAVTLNPVVDWIEEHGWPRWAGYAVVVLTLVGSLAAFFVGLLPIVGGEVSRIFNELPRLQRDIEQYIPRHGIFHKIFQQNIQNPKLPAPGQVLPQLVVIGGYALNGIAQLLLFVVFTIYLLVDGPRAYRWLLAFFASDNRIKLERTADEVSGIMLRYMAAQVITSIFAAVFAFASLSFLHVPAALALAVLAGVLDVLPVLGFFISVVPAALLALTVSPTAALLTVGFYLLYHGIENYLIVPKVYGSRMRLSTLMVLIGLLIGGTLAGVLGAIAVLPVLASYPVIEKIWLVNYLGRHVVKKHEIQSQEEKEETKRSA